MRKPSLIALLLIFLGVVYAYADTLFFPFVFDDLPAIVNNTAVQSEHPWIAIWHYAPERWFGFASFALNYQLHGFDVRGFHLVNIMLHLCAAAVLFIFMNRLLRHLTAQSEFANPISLLVVTLFTLHPIQTAAVTYIHQRLAIIPMILYFLGLFLWLRFREECIRGRRRSYHMAGLLLCGLVGMFSKEVFVTFPIAVILVDAYAFREVKFWSLERWKRFVPVLCLMLVLPASFFLKYGSVGARVGDYGTEGVSSVVYLATQAGVVWRYLGIIFFMAPQNADHDIAWQHSLFSPDVMIYGAGLIALIIFAAFSAKKRPAVSLGILIMFLGLSVESSVIPIRDPMFEHRMYLPSAGVFLAVSSLLVSFLDWVSRVFRTYSGGLNPLVYSLCLILGAGLVHQTISRNEVWASAESFWGDVVAKSPRKPRGYINLAASLLREGDAKASLAVSDRLSMFAPQNSDGLYTGIMALLAMGDAENSQLRLEKFSAVVSVDDPRVPYIRAKLFVMRRELREAVSAFEQCFELIKSKSSMRPDFYGSALVSMTEVLIEMRDYPRAASIILEARSVLGETAGVLLADARLAFDQGRNLDGEKFLARLSTRGSLFALLAERELGIRLSAIGDKPRAVAVLELIKKSLEQAVRNPDIVVDSFLALNLPEAPPKWESISSCDDLTVGARTFTSVGRVADFNRYKQGLEILCRHYGDQCRRCSTVLEAIRLGNF